MPDGDRSRIRRGRKFDQVLAGAREIFLRDGYEGASVDEIARAAGVSKATLYSYVPDKELLFMEVAKAECRRQADSAIAALDMDRPVREILCEVGRQLTCFITSEFGQRIFRICVAEADRFPQIGREFYDSGPKLVRERVMQLLRVAIDRHELVIDDLELAADQFAELCKADLFPRMVFHRETGFAPQEIDRVVDGAVETFLARYGA